MSARRISRRADATWKRLSSWYGARLAEQYGAQPPEDWCELIDRTDPERLDLALMAVRRTSPAHPPTLGQLEGAIPNRQNSNEPSLVEQLSAGVMRFLGKQLCKHQIAAVWNYYGPIEEHSSKHRNGEISVHPRPVGVQIPACADCGNGSHRMTLEDIAKRAA